MMLNTIKNDNENKKKNENKNIHGLTVRWAYVPYKEQPDKVKKRPVVVLSDNAKTHQAYVLRITSQFDSKPSYEKMCRFRIGKMNPLKRNGLTKSSYVDLSEAQGLNDSLFLKHGFVGHLSIFVSLKLMKAGYKYQEAQRQQRLRDLITYYQNLLKNKHINHSFNSHSILNPLFYYGHNLVLTKQQKVSNIENVNSQIKKIKTLNHWKQHQK